MRRSGFVGIALLGTLVVLAMAEPVEAQRRARRGRAMSRSTIPATQFYLPPESATLSPDQSRLSFYPALLARNIAQIEMRLPNPDAEVKFDGQLTRQKGVMRIFTTPPLDGTYTYQVTAAWQQDGQRLTRERTISVRPGASVMLDFTTEAGSRDLNRPIRDE
jgi:uncharacterized protein (TIGR03000 family)